MLAPLAASLVQPVIYPAVKGKNGRGVRRAGRWYVDKKFLVSLYHLSNIEICNYKSRFNGAFSRKYLPIIKGGACVIYLDVKKI